MNLVGKIFVFLIMVMSVCFAMLAVGVYMTQNTWREKVVLSRQDQADPKNAGKPLGLKYQLADEEARRKELEDKIKSLENQYKSDLALERQAKIKAENEKVLLSVDNDKLRKDKLEVLAIHEKELAKVAAAQVELSDRQKQIVVIKEEIRDARGKIDTLFKQVVNLTEGNHGYAMDVRNLKPRNESLEKKLAENKVKAAVYGLDLDLPVNRSQSGIEGVVTNVRTIDRSIYVSMSIGSDDGLLKGHTLTVFRGTTPLGKAVVISTEPDKSVGRVDDPKGQIQVSDKVKGKAPQLQTAGVNVNAR